jgi:hypothetical protein
MQLTFTLLSHPAFKAARVAVAAGSLAGLAVLGACTDGAVSKVAGPRAFAPLFGTGVVGALDHKVQVCVDLSSPAGPGLGGTYSFSASAAPTGVAPYPWFELQSSSDPDLSGAPTFITQNSMGPFNAGGNNDVVTPSVLVAPGACADVFVRANTCPGGVCSGNPADHAGNRLWTDVNGTTNPYASVIITNTDAGLSFTMNCTNDDPGNPQICVDGGYSSANVFHGSAFTYKFGAACPVGELTAGFNGTAIPAPRTVWFVANLKPHGPIVDGTVITFTGANIHLSNGGLPPAGVDVPSTNGQITYSAAAALATTSYNIATNTWETIVPLSWGDKDVFLAGTQYSPPGGLTGGAKATWTGAFASTTAGVTAKWQFAASVYDPFNTDYNALGVKPIDSKTLTIYPNNDKQGTPENYKLNLKSGAMGGGGSNFIGSWSSTKAVCVN